METDNNYPEPINNSLRRISGKNEIFINGSDGSRLFWNANDIFNDIDKDFIELGLDKPGIVTPGTFVQVYEITHNRNNMSIFETLPGKWSQKWMSQHQALDFLEYQSRWLSSKNTFFIIKKDENKPIDENNPGSNLVVAMASVSLFSLDSFVYPLNYYHVWNGEAGHRVVCPQLAV